MPVHAPVRGGWPGAESAIEAAVIPAETLPVSWALAYAVVGAVIAFFAITLFERWWVGFSARRMVDRAIRETPFAESKAPARLMPESLFVVELSDTGVTCSRPDRNVESVTWNDLQCVEVMTTDEGPFAPDVYWVLHGSTGGCVIPQGATGDSELLQRLQKLPGFDNGPFIRAMSSVTNQRFVCWRRPSAIA